MKAQIHAGGRGKGGGVKLARSADEAAEIASQILGMNLITAQTGPQGRIVKRLLIEEGLDIKRELYFRSLSIARPGARVYGQHVRRHGNRAGGERDPATILTSTLIRRLVSNRIRRESLRLDWD